MKLSTAISASACVAVAAAQSSPGAPYDIGDYLPVDYNGSVAVQPGEIFSPDQVATGPSFGIAQDNVSASQPYCVIMIDINVVLNESTGVQSEFLHRLQPNLYAVNGTSGNLTFLSNGPNASTVVGASYYPPTPPEGPPHHYNFFIFEQPANFTMPPNFTRFNEPADLYARVNFNITQFADESGLGQPIAANYARIFNGTAAQASSIATQTATSGVAFPSGFRYNSDTATGGTASGTVTSATSATGSATRSSSGSAASPTSSSSSASDSNEMGQTFVKAVCLAVAATLPWIW